MSWGYRNLRAYSRREETPKPPSALAAATPDLGSATIVPNPLDRSVAPKVAAAVAKAAP